MESMMTSEFNLTDYDVDAIKANLACLLIEDMTSTCVPVHLKCMLDHFQEEDLTQGELLFILIYTIAIESGYICDRVYDEMEKRKMEIANLTPTTTFHAKNIIKCSLIKPTITSMANKSRFTMRLRLLINNGVIIRTENDLIVQLTGFLSGDLMIVTFIPDVTTNTSGASIALPISRYILSDWAKEKHLYERYVKVKDLLRMVRDQLLLPIRNQQLHLLQANVFPSLDALPVELYDKILQYLDPVQMRKLIQVNRSLRNAVLYSKYEK